MNLFGLGDVWDNTVGAAWKGTWGGIKEVGRTLFTGIGNALEPVFKLIGIEDKTIYSTEIKCLPLLEEVPESYLKGLIVGSIINRTPLSSAIIRGLVTGPGSVYRKYVDYGEESYLYGLSEIIVARTIATYDIIKTVIQNIENQPVTFKDVRIGIPPDYIWSRYSLALEDSNYNISDDTYLLGDNYFFLEGYTISDSTGTYRFRFYLDVVEINEDEEEENIRWYHDVVTEASPILYSDTEYYSVVYIVNNITKYFVYKRGTGTYPALDNMVNEDLPTSPDLGIIKDYYKEQGATLFKSGSPVLILRKGDVSNKTNFNDDKNSEWYKDTIKAADIINIDVEAILEQVATSESYNDITGTYVVNAVNIYNTDIGSLSYLWVLFHFLSGVSNFTKPAYDAATVEERFNNRSTYIVKEDQFTVILNYGYFNSRYHTGSIGDIGFIKSEIFIRPDEVDESKNIKLPGSSISLYRQFDIDTYIEFELHGISCIYLLPKDNNRVDAKEILLSDDVEIRKSFNIPIDSFIINFLNVYEQEELLNRSLTLVVTAGASQHLEYYQTPAFIKLVDIVLKVIAIVILVVSVGTAGSTSAALIEIGKQLLIQYALQVTLKLVLESSLPDEVKALAAVLYIYASYQLGVGDTASTLIKDIGILLNSTGFVLTTYTGIEGDKLREQIEQEKEVYEEYQDKLDQARDMLDDSIFDPAHINSSLIIKPEYPDNYLDRTRINSMKLMTDSTSLYVDSALNLNLM